MASGKGDGDMVLGAGAWLARLHWCAGSREW